MINPWWRGGFFEPPEPISILELVNFGSLDLRLAGILWLMMERRASVVVAAGPSNAGKSTLLGALMDLLPPGVEQIHLMNTVEDIIFSEDTVPANTYLVASEISNHGFYLWGHEAWRAFELLSGGCGLSGTMHARTVRETIDILHIALGLPLSQIANLDAVVTIRMTGSWEAPVRRVEAVGLITPEKDGLSIRIISSRSLDNEELNFADDGELYAALSGKIGISANLIGPEIQLREQFLGNLIKQDSISPEEVKKAAIEFYRSRHP